MKYQAGYEAYSILNYGIDRNGNFIPVFLVAWGSGQNVLLSYLIIPFIKIFGLNILSVRLPMAILGCISLIVMYLLLKKISNKKIALMGLIFFAICPWHIMKSRWGLESNLFPDIVLIFVYVLINGIDDKNKILYYFSFVIAGITAYAYGTSYFFLPMFLIPLLSILVKKQKITIKQAIVSLMIVAIVALPIILFVIINTFNLEQINLPFLTIPKLEVNRYKEITSIFSNNSIILSLSNFLESIKILILQNDELGWNSIPQFGLIYIFSSIFAIIGIVFSFRKNEKVKVEYSYIFNIWFIVSIILTFICVPNINRLNIIMIPIIYYCIIGLYVVIDERKTLTVPLSSIYLISFILFINVYMNQNWDNYSVFEAELQDPIVYITNSIKEPYIYVLYYAKYNTNDFVNSVEYQNKYVEFRQVKNFGEYNFENIKYIEDNHNNVYLLKKSEFELLGVNLENLNIKEFGKYVVLVNE